MKNNFTLIKKMSFVLTCCCMSWISSFGQVTDLVTGLGNPVAATLIGNDLYITEAISNKISKVDISATTPQVEDVAGLSQPLGITNKGNILYVTNQVGFKMYTVDVSQTTPVPTEVATLAGFAGTLTIADDILYAPEYEADRVISFNISQPIPTPVDTFLLVNHPYGVAVKGNDLYVSEWNGGRVLKYDVTQPSQSPTVVLENLTGVRGLTINGNFLYLGNGVGVNGKISRIDLNETNPMVEDLTTEITHPRIGIFDNADMYIVDFDADKVVKFANVPPAFSTSISTPTCADDMLGVLGGASPTGGIYSGPNVIDNGDGENFIFDAATAGAGMHTITYTIGGQSVNGNIDLVALPTVSLTLPDTVFIIDGTLPMGIGGGMPAGGIYTDAYSEITDDGNGMTFSFNNSVAVGELNQIIYTYTDPTTGCTNSDAQIIFVAAATDVNDLENINLEIFPNPTTGIIKLEGDVLDRIEVIDINGKIIQVETTPTSTLNISDYPTGIYFLRINVGDQVATQRIIKN